MEGLQERSFSPPCVGMRGGGFFFLLGLFCWGGEGSFFFFFWGGSFFLGRFFAVEVRKSENDFFFLFSDERESGWPASFSV